MPGAAGPKLGQRKGQDAALSVPANNNSVTSSSKEGRLSYRPDVLPGGIHGNQAMLLGHVLHP
jgi:hypothetical protein